MKADINITPLIDVLLVLLIIFMLVTPTAPSALQASLPQPARGEERQAAPGLVLEVEADAWRLNGTPALGTADLASRLRTAFDGRSDRTLFVRVAPGVGYARVVESLDLAQECGASRIGLVDAEAR